MRNPGEKGCCPFWYDSWNIWRVGSGRKVLGGKDWLHMHLRKRGGLWASSTYIHLHSKYADCWLGRYITNVGQKLVHMCIK